MKAAIVAAAIGGCLAVLEGLLLIVLGGLAGLAENRESEATVTERRRVSVSGRRDPAELILRDGRLSAQLHVEAAFLVAAVGLDRDLVADLLAHDRLAEVLRA